jgi:hypothetical protein
MSKIKTLAGELAAIALQKQELANKEEVIKDALLTEMHKAGVEKEATDYGTASISRRKSYTYSDVVKKLEDKVKIKKDEEVKQGLATVKETEFITFRIKTDK